LKKEGFDLPKSHWFGIYSVLDEDVYVKYFHVIGDKKQKFIHKVELPSESGIYFIKYFKNKTDFILKSNAIHVGPVYDLSLEFAKNSNNEIEFLLKTSFKRVSGQPLEKGCWIGLFSKTETDNTKPLEYHNVIGEKGVVFFQLPKVHGEHVVRLFLSDVTFLQESKALEISETQVTENFKFKEKIHKNGLPTLKIPKETYQKATIDIEVEFESNFDSSTKNSWIGLYKTDKPEVCVSYFYVTAKGRSTIIPFTLPNTTGEYQLKYFEIKECLSTESFEIKSIYF
jgi:hypothetical protein